VHELVAQYACIVERRGAREIPASEKPFDLADTRSEALTSEYPHSMIARVATARGALVERQPMNPARKKPVEDHEDPTRDRLLYSGGRARFGSGDGQVRAPRRIAEERIHWPDFIRRPRSPAPEAPARSPADEPDGT
jgi:hypothetical protein